MRKVNKILLFILLLIPIRVNALTGNISLDCITVTSNKNKNIVCNVNATSDEKINGVKADIVLSDNLEFISFETNSDWQGDASENQIGLYSGENVSGILNLGVLKVGVKTGNEGTIDLKNCLYSDEKFNKVEIEDSSINIKIKSDNNRLASLEVLPETINFDPEVLEYSVTVDSPTVTITPVAEHEKASISGDKGTRTLNYGLNTLKINVTSESGEKRVYTLNVTRKDNRNSENRLSNLIISGNKIEFDENVYNYNLMVDYKTSSIRISAILKDSTANFVRDYGPGTKSLKEGENKIEIKVSAENGSIKTYTINVIRSEDPNNKSDDNFLEDIEIKDSDINFDKEEEEYKVTVDRNTNSLDLNAISSSNKSKVEIIGNDNFQIGENTVTIKVTSADGEVREYKIIVIKTNEEKVLSNNANLEKLEIEDYEIKFNKNELNYEIEIANEKELIITALPVDDKASVEIIGNENLKNSSIIRIIVTAEDGTKKEYVINVIKRNYLLIMLIVEAVTVLGIIGYSLIILKRKKRNKTNEKI